MNRKSNMSNCIWNKQKWKHNPCFNDDSHKHGLRMQCDKGVHPDVKKACKDFAVFLRNNYYFPKRVTVYVKENYRIIAKDGDKVVGTFFHYYDNHKYPFIKVAAGDFIDLCKNSDKKQALISIMEVIAHELTHYFQWINNIQLSSKGLERQATNHQVEILNEYVNYRESQLDEEWELMFGCGENCRICDYFGICLKSLER